MRKLNILLLGWDFLPSVYEKQQTGCYPIAKVLASRVNLEVLLPQTDPAFNLSNAELTGLNQVDLEAIQPTASQPASLPYADEGFIRNDIPLYGSSGAVKHPQNQAGQQQTTGTFVPVTSMPVKQNNRAQNGVAPLNIFAYKDFAALGLDAQVIQYARYACRWAAQRNFDLIYAYNYMTFLAGTELKLVSGKKLILHVDGLSYGCCNPNSKGWMQELEKQALQKCDYIFTSTDSLATILEQEYNLSPAVIKSLEKVKTVAKPEVNALIDALPANVLLTKPTWGNFAPSAETMVLEKAEKDWQQTADTIWGVMQKLATC